MKAGNWKTISSERHFADPNLQVVTDRVQTPARAEPRAWTIVHRKAAVVIAPMTADGKIVLIHQERIPIREVIWEMPSGQIDTIAGMSKERRSATGRIRRGELGQPSEHDGCEAVTPCSETIEQVALRELREEAGYELAQRGELIPLGHYFTSPGFTDERGHFFLAHPVQPRKEGPERDEGESILDCRRFSVEEIRRMIADNEIRDANTLSLCARLWARGLLPSGSA